MLLCLILSVVSTSFGSTKLKYPIDHNSGGVQGPYRASLLELIKNWPKDAIEFDTKKPDAVKLVPYETKDHPLAIGVGQVMLVKSPLSEVKKIMEDFEHYKDLFFTFKDVRILERDANRVATEWEQSIPLPFIPNTKYSTWFYIDDRSKERVFYRYELKESSDLIYSEGVMVLDRVDDQITRYSEFDFFDAKWGIGAAAGPTRIWSDSMRDIYLSDIAIRMKAEHPNWDYKKIETESRQNYKLQVSSDDLKTLLEKKKKFNAQ